MDFIARPDRAPPILWVGAGASAAAGYPTLGQLEALLRKKIPGCTETGFGIIDAYIRKFSKVDLLNELQTSLGVPRGPAPLHEAIARLAGADLFSALYTTNYDRLLEDALSAQGICHIVQTLEDNYSVQARRQLLVVKLHGDQGDWRTCVLSAASYHSFQTDYPRLQRQLDLALRTHPVIFVGCSLRDPRLLDWLRSLPDVERDMLYASRAILTHSEWNTLGTEERQLLREANIQPLQVDSHAAVTQILKEVARRLAPLAPTELVFELRPGERTWITVGPTAESPPHEVPTPLANRELLERLHRLRQLASTPVLPGAPEGARAAQMLWDLARDLGARLTEVLLSRESQQQVVRRLHEVDRGRARLTVRVMARGPLADQALALPWELLMPEPGVLAVHEMMLDLVREAASPGAPELAPPTQGLQVAVSIAAPENLGLLRYEEEAYRLLKSLAPLGHAVSFAELGGLDDLVKLAEEQMPTALHFSGHGLPGHLVFEDEVGFANEVPVGELSRRLRERLSPSGVGRPFPRLFFLASCHGATEARLPPVAAGVGGMEWDDLDLVLGQGPSTAAALHRSGFTQVVGYFGPIADALCTRAEEGFYSAVAQGKTTLQAVAEARGSLCRDVERGGVTARYPLAWMQLVLYHRGHDRPLALPGQPQAVALPSRFVRREAEGVRGLPVLELGFIGRRSMQHLIRRRVKAGQQLIVLQGMGGLGKTALANQMLSQVFARADEDRLILTCRELEGVTDPAAQLWAQAEEHGGRLGLAGWPEVMARLREVERDPARGFEQTVKKLRERRPGLVVYADNLESLQAGPKVGADQEVGSWLPQAEAWWLAMERLAQGGLVLASTRYAWKDLHPDAVVGIEPMRPADSLRMIESYSELGQLPYQVRVRLSEMVDGHPRTVDYLNRLVGERRIELGRGEMVRDSWAVLIEPVLPKNTAKLRADLLLEQLWARLSDAAQSHAMMLSVLRVPAPEAVVESLGQARAELLRTGVLVEYREQVLTEGKLVWVQRWGMHSITVRFVMAKMDIDAVSHAHRAAGQAYEAWLRQRGALWSEHEEGIHHLHAAGEGDRAWPMVREYVPWLREKARYREARALLERCEGAGTQGENLAEALGLLAQICNAMGDVPVGMMQVLDRALSMSQSEDIRGFVLQEQAALYRAQGRYHQAESRLQQALALKGNTPGPATHSYGTILFALATVVQAQGKYPEAESLRKTDHRDHLDRSIVIT